MIPKCSCLETHSFSLPLLHHSALLRLLKPRLMQIFPHHDVDMWGRVWMSRFRWAWSSLNFYKEYLFGFETLVFATSGIVSMHNQLVTLKEKAKYPPVSSQSPFLETHSCCKSLSLNPLNCFLPVDVSCGTSSVLRMSTWITAVSSERWGTSQWLL